MIRTDIVALTTLQAIAYRLKLTSGGAGIVIMRSDFAQPGIASISKTSGDPIPTANTPADKYPREAFQEAIALTSGMPYSKRGTPPQQAAVPAADEPEETQALEVLIDSTEYQKIVDAYTDKNGKLSYALLNKDMIKFAHSSSRVRLMIEKKSSLEDIRLYAVGTKFRHITGNSHLSDDQVQKMIGLLDEVSPKGVLTEFTEELRRSLKK